MASRQRPLYSLVQANSPSSIIELADGGKRFRKQLVKFGTFADPANRAHGKMVLDKTWGEKIKQNFDKRTVGRVPVPLGHPRTASELAQLNRGEVMDVEVEEDGIYGNLDIRDPKAAADIENDLLWDVSVSFENDYIDTRGNECGPTLLHVGLLTDPYIREMEPFQALENGHKGIMLSESEDYDMTTVQVKNDRAFAITVKYKDGDAERELVIEPGQEAEVPSEVGEDITKQLADAAEPEKVEEGKAEPAKVEPAAPVVPGVTEPTEREKELQKELDATKAQLSLQTAEASYNELLRAGKIVPAQKELFLSLFSVSSSTVNLSDGSTKPLNATLTEFLKAAPTRISFSEQGQGEGEGAVEQTPYDKLSDEEKSGLEKLGTSKDEYNENNSDTSVASDDNDDEE